MQRLVFDMATEADEAELRRLYAETPMGVEMELSFQRDPNYFHAVKTQGLFHQVWVAREVESGEIVATGTRSLRPSFVNGEVRELGYLADARIRRDYRSSPLAAQMVRNLRRLHDDGRTDIYFTAIFEDNRSALRTLASGRFGLPTYHDMGKFYSYAIGLGGLWGPRANISGGVEIVRGVDDLLPEVVDCLNRNGSRKQFSPFYTVEDFQQTDGWLRDFHIEDFNVARKAGRVIGVLGKWDQRRFKQTVVFGYRGKLRLFRPWYNLGAKILGYPSYPRPRAPLNFFYAGFVAIDDDNAAVLGALLRHLWDDHRGGGYSYFLIGLHSQDPLAECLKGFRVVSIPSRLYCACYEDGAETFRKLESRVPHVEIAML